MGPSDTELIARVLGRDDRHAFATLVRRHQRGVRGLLRRLSGGDEALSDDLAQETFLRAYRGLRGYRGGARFSTWLYRIAYNVYLSKRPARDEVAIDAVPETAGIDDRGDPMLQRRLEQAMSTLSPSESAALTLFYRDGASHAEIAAVLGEPLGTVKTKILRGKEKLRRRLARLGVRRTA